MRHVINAGRWQFAACHSRRKEAEVATASTGTTFVIASRHDPGRSLEQRSSRIKEIRFPGQPVVPMRASAAAAISRRACALTIEIISDVNDDIGPSIRDSGRNAPEWPFSGRVAILELTRPMIVRFMLAARRVLTLHSATGISERRY